ncbi:hypothetical protein M3223_18970 [Paenibacillus pasadenensis]|uniref:hypothetical protein n=1 Tax=Paenibacillus pasadenensis TaxID=217090 RepID=UPI00203D1758|nr:hypothetical protein [Paenibacillus pasadenensis]MCM3749438.1 hypothetical protein [Paenibacillus pasadenensis]
MENQTSPQVEAGTLKPGIENLFTIITTELDSRIQNGLSGEEGDALKGLLAEAREALAKEDYAAAEAHLAAMKERQPELGAIQAAVLYTLIGQQKWEAFAQQEELLLQTASSVEEKSDMQAMLANLLGEHGHFDQVVDRLEKLSAAHPERGSDFAPLLSAVYIRVGRSEDAWNVVNAALPSEGEEKPVHLPLIVAYINRVIDLKKWDRWSKIQLRVRRFLKSLEAEDDVVRARVVLLLECQSYMQAGRFREAELFADLVYGMDSKSEEIRELRKQMQEMNALTKELEKLQKDTAVHPAIVVRNMEWYYGEFNEEAASNLRAQLPAEVLKRVDSDPEKLMNGILQLRFRYPAFYRRYQEEWQEVYKEKQAELAGK